MATQRYRIDNLDCANCAAKLEAKYNTLPQVESAVITFATRQLRVTADDPDSLIPQMEQLARTVEPDAKILPWDSGPRDHPEHRHDHDGCSAEHPSHNHDGDCRCQGHGGHTHRPELPADGDDPDRDHESGRGEGLQILVGAGLFLLGVVLERLHTGLWAIAVYVCAYLCLGLEVLKIAGKNLIHGRVFDENFLMSLATLGAFAIREYPEAVGVMLFYRIGEWFEHRAVEQSRRQIMDAVDLRPEVVNRLKGEQTEAIPAGEAQVGDLLLVRPGDRIPLDGVVVSGDSRLDTAPITGEPVPVHVAVGDSVTSGCVNTSGRLVIRVEKPLSESMVTRILDSVENAAASKPKIDRFITRFSRVYTPVVVGLAAATAVIPSLVTGNWSYWVYTALSFLVMSCPCALVLSVPLAFFSGIGAGSREGILFKGGVSMEAMAGVKAVAMDKTGTLTKGTFTVQPDCDSALLALCAGCEQSSTHPIAQSIVAAARERGLAIPEAEKIEELSGRGIRAQIGGKTVLCGSEVLLRENGVTVPEGCAAGSPVFAAVDGVYAGHLVVSDTVKPDAAQAMADLKAMGVTTAILTGDREATAQAVARELGVVDEVHARLLPEEKLSRLQDIRSRAGAVMFVGDGINDAPVLSGADVGAAMGSGADAAIEAADVVFLTSQTSAIPKSLAIARHTKSVAWQNVIFALAVKIAVMLLGLCGHASMWMAVFADSGVAMLCVLNSVRLLWRRKEKGDGPLPRH